MLRYPSIDAVFHDLESAKALGFTQLIRLIVMDLYRFWNEMPVENQDDFVLQVFNAGVGDHFLAMQPFNILSNWDEGPTAEILSSYASQPFPKLLDDIHEDCGFFKIVISPEDDFDPITFSEPECAARLNALYDTETFIMFSNDIVPLVFLVDSLPQFPSIQNNKVIREVSVVNMRINNQFKTFIKKFKKLAHLSMESCDVIVQDNILGNPNHQPFANTLKAVSFTMMSVTSLKFLSGFSKVERLDLSKCPDTPWSDLSAMEQLKHLDISENQLNDFSFVPNKLEVLHISNNPIQSISHLSSLPQLKELNMENTQVTDFTPLASLKSLGTLNVEGNQLNDLSIIQELSHLKVLNAANTGISSAEPLRSLTNLLILILSENNLVDLSPLSELESLQVLSVKFNQITDISPLAPLVNLAQFFLSGNPVNDMSVISHFDKITVLEIAETLVTNVDFLSSLRQLQTLDIAGVNVSQEQVRASLNDAGLQIAMIRWTFDSDFLPEAFNNFHFEISFQADAGPKITIQRDNVFESVKEYYLNHSPQEILAANFEFDGEPGVDGGGITKEFVRLFSLEMISPQKELFEFNEDSGLYYFKPYDGPLSPGQLENYMLVGKFIGFALVNQIPLEVEFPMAFYELLLNSERKFRLKDLKSFDKDLYRSYLQITQMSDQELESMDLTFSDEKGRKLVNDIPRNRRVRASNSKRFVK
jgi:Leucine-rich repeat (LRR) protein